MMPATCSSHATRTPLLLYALVLLAIFFAAEPMRPDFSVSDTFNITDSEETTLDRIESNIQAHRDGKLGRKLGMLLLAGWGVVLLLRSDLEDFRIQGSTAWLTVLFLSWCLVSVFWSATPGITLRRVVVLFSLALGAAGIARRFALDDLMRLTLLVTGLISGLGLACELACGGLRPWMEGYRFSGLTWPAFTCWTLSLFILALLITRCGQRIRLSNWMLAVAGVLLVMTKTRAGAGALVAALLIYGAAMWPFGLQAAVAVVSGFSVTAGLLWAAFSGLDLHEMVVTAVNFGRAESVTDISGRAGVWTALVPHILARPLHGYGYESFWTPEHLVAIGEDNWGAPDAHNGYINLALGVGIIGSVLYAAILISALWQSRTIYFATRRPGYLFAGCVLIVTMVNSLCVATQLGPYFMSFASMLVIARLAFERAPQLSPPIPTSPRELARDPLLDSRRSTEPLEETVTT